jgi:HEPN domain-containing protein
MDDALRHEVEQWLLKSQRDLRAAYLLFESEEALLDVVVYHCQQSDGGVCDSFCEVRFV